MLNRFAAAATVAVIIALPASAEPPLSAIDWLSESVATPAAMTVPSAGTANPLRLTPQAVRKPGVARNVLPEKITVQSLDAPQLDAVGLLPPATTGLPRNLWGSTPQADLIALLRRERVDTLPAVQSLLYMLLLAELDPPRDSDGSGALLMARVDRLLDLGALDQAAALLEQSGAATPELFRRAFDVALLRGEEDAVCEGMLRSPGIAPTLTARIFCLARAGDWNAAALTLRTAESLGQVDAADGELLARFLDPDLYEDEPPLAQPQRPTPLIWRIFEALGEPIPTTGLPVAFANADLRANTGWKQQLDAAERLARNGAIAPAQVFALYDAGRPSASGGIWDRISAVQRLEQALAARDAAAVSALLPEAYAMVAEAELEVPFAEAYAERVLVLPLEGRGARVAWRMGMLSTDYETVAARNTASSAQERFAEGVARGNLAGLATQDGLTRAIAVGFAGGELSEANRILLAEGKQGEALLRALDGITDGVKGDLRAVSEALALLRSIGMESDARRIALELMLLERRG